MTAYTRIWFVLLAVVASHSTVFAQGTAFTYQGRLSTNSIAVTGLFDFRFAVYDAASGGNQIGGTLTPTAVPVTNGLFTVTLDFGANVFTGPTRYLDLAAKTNSSPAAFVSMTPRQTVTAAPYAMLAGGLNGALPAGNLAGTYGNAVTLSNLANYFYGSFSGSGASLSNLNLSAVGPAGLLTLTPTTIPPVTGGTLQEISTNFITLPGSSVPIGMVATDVNGDGSLDLLVATTNINTVTVLTNNKSGGFAVASTFSLSSPPTSISVLAPTGPASLLVICSTLQGYQVLANDGVGNLSANSSSSYNQGAQQFLISSVAFQSGVFGVIAFGDNKGNVYLPQSSSTPFNIQASASNIHIGVITNVATVELIAADYLGNRVAVFDSGVGSTPTFYAVGNGPAQVIAIDVNGDGFQDLVTANLAGGSLTVLTNNGSGSFGRYATVANVGHPVSVAAADLNGDGLVDLLCADTNSTGSINIFTNNGHAAFGSFSSVTSYGPSCLITGDFNNDTVPDFAFGNTFSFFATTVCVRLTIPPTINLDGAVRMASPFNVLGGTFSGMVNASTLTVSGLATGNFTGTFAGNGAGLTNLNATQLTSGTLPLARLPGVVETNGSSLKVGTGGTVFTRVQAGQAIMNIPIVTSHTNFTFTFPQAFTGTPKIIVTPSNDPGFNNVDDTFNLTVRNVTTTTCTVNIIRLDAATSWSQNVRINWQAWE